MPVEKFGRKIEKIGIIGSGQIGPDIALYFSTALSGFNIPVVVVDIVENALINGRNRVEGKLKKLVEKGKLTADTAKIIKDSFSWTTRYDELKGATLVIEAATEDLNIKKKIFSTLEEICSKETILASNSSHMEPEIIFENALIKGRTIVNHFFFPAERNIVVEIVPGKETSSDVVQFLMKFYEAFGKMPILVKSRYGYAVDPVFEGLFQAAALCVESGISTVKEVDTVARKALGLGVGPFTAMNLTGGNPITAKGLDAYNEKIHKWFRTPDILKKALESGKQWDVPGRDEKVEVSQEKEEEITNLMRGAYFGLVTEILDSQIATLSDLEVAVSTALVIEPPFAFMNKLGVGKALELVEKYHNRYPQFPVPEVLKKQAESGKPWKIPVVLREDKGDIAIIKIRRPAVLNALNPEVMEQLYEHFLNIKNDSSIKGAIITGFGNRAFVSGADINQLAKIKTPEEGESFSWKGQEVLLFIENLGKPVVAALNGLAFGGGCELAMACTARIAVKAKVLIAQPEPKLGIIPGYGGTQRFPRWVGIQNCWKILRDGNPISSSEALRIGLIQKEVDGDVVEVALDFIHQIINNQVKIPQIRKDPIELPDKLPEVDIGHLSRKIDEIMQKAILEGAKMKLEDGLKFEAKMFGECIKTEDMRIGMENFLKNGPKVNAQFVHR